MRRAQQLGQNPRRRHLWRFLVWFAKTLLFVKRPAPLLAAGLRGFRQGVRGNLDNRY
jgi:hypothetical protein